MADDDLTFSVYGFSPANPESSPAPRVFSSPQEARPEDNSGDDTTLTDPDGSGTKRSPYTPASCTKLTESNDESKTKGGTEAVNNPGLLAPLQSIRQPSLPSSLLGFSTPANPLGPTFGRLNGWNANYRNRADSECYGLPRQYHVEDRTTSIPSILRSLGLPSREAPLGSSPLRAVFRPGDFSSDEEDDANGNDDYHASSLSGTVSQHDPVRRVLWRSQVLSRGSGAVGDPIPSTPWRNTGQPRAFSSTNRLDDSTSAANPLAARFSSMTLGPTAPATFRPMNARVAPLLSAQPTLSPNDSPSPLMPMSHQRILAGFSPNYRGNILLDRNRSAPIPDAENCSLWLTDLPADVTTTELLSAIRNAGRIYASHINAPEPARGHHRAAAKVIFFECAAAQAFLARGLALGFSVRGHPVRLKHNRIRTAEPLEPAYKSRVLLITTAAVSAAGPVAEGGSISSSHGDGLLGVTVPLLPPPSPNVERMVTADYLNAYFATKLEFQVDRVLERRAWDGRPVVEFRFGSFRCQAESAKMAVARELTPLGIVAHYAPDPCAPGVEK